MRMIDGLTSIIGIMLRLSKDLKRTDEVERVHARVQCE